MTTIRFLDQFLQVLESRSGSLDVQIEDVGVFLDLWWDVPIDLEQAQRDPAFVVQRIGRWLAFQRVEGELRFYASILPPNNYGSEYQMGIVSSVEDAVCVAKRYLSGEALSSIQVPRTPFSGVGAPPGPLALLLDPIDVETWEEAPNVSRRLASPEDVDAGRAVFHVPPQFAEGIVPADIDLPKCAYFHDLGQDIPVIVIQAQVEDGELVFGIRYVHGYIPARRRICRMVDLTFVEEPDESFWSK